MFGKKGLFTVISCTALEKLKYNIFVSRHPVICLTCLVSWIFV